MIASVTYNTSGSAGPYTLTFPYLEQADVDVYLDGVANTAFTFTSATQITLNSAPSAVEIEIRRNTTNDPYVDFTAPAPIIPEDLDTATLQAIYIAQEAKDGDAVLQDQIDALETAVIVAGNVPAPAGADVGQYLKATATNTFSWEDVAATSAQISDSTPAGRALLTAENPQIPHVHPRSTVSKLPAALVSINPIANQVFGG